MAEPSGQTVDPLDPRGLRAQAPILDAYLRALESETTSFTIPGHKGRTDLVGPVVRGDVPLHGGVDTIGLAHGVLIEGERRAARLWGADWCRFSVAGSTHGNQALALAVAEPGSTVVVSRSLHRSMLSGLVLAGLHPVWVHPSIDPSTGLPGGVDATELRSTLRTHPSARAVFVGDPSYVGGMGDVGALAEAAHDHDVPVIVDAAWGAHFGFHPDLPRHALALGADALVTSAHKTLPAISQAAVVLARTERLDVDRLERGFDATHTTSPAGAILASIDAARALLERDGHELLGRLLALVASARQRLDALEGVRVLGGPGVDPTKLVLVLDGHGPSGEEIERHLLSLGIPVEMADRRTVIPMVTMADDDRSVDRLVTAISELTADWSPQPIETHVAATRTATVWSLRAETVISPRDAFFAPHETVPVAHAVGRVSAEVIAPYPPGIPVLAPGERVTSEALEVLWNARADGSRIAYAADPTLQSVQVVRSV